MIRRIALAASSLMVLTSLAMTVPASHGQSAASSTSQSSDEGPIMKLHKKIRSMRPHIVRKTFKRLASGGKSSTAPATTPPAASPKTP